METNVLWGMGTFWRVAAVYVVGFFAMGWALRADQRAWERHEAMLRAAEQGGGGPMGGESAAEARELNRSTM